MKHGTTDGIHKHAQIFGKIRSSYYYKICILLYISFFLLLISPPCSPLPQPCRESILWFSVSHPFSKVPSLIILRHTSCNFHIRKFPKVREGKWLIPFIQCLTSPFFPHFPPPPCVNRKFKKEKLSESSSWEWRNPGTLYCSNTKTTIIVSPLQRTSKKRDTSSNKQTGKKHRSQALKVGLEIQQSTKRSRDSTYCVTKPVS
ncbi:replication factor C subunit 1 [Platysternon megacephalum]|uniref:Replication factor C subunit 1 n=1 Tax=Platysternon megacephalum TaxID=55544 RepID=A0A4D9EWV6_9SAUR|nr:replication factor C subunit 1 [Platysternon megacephalum]